MWQDKSMQQRSDREQADEHISQLHEQGQLVRSPEVGHSGCGEAGAERQLSRAAVGFRNEFASTFHWEALELVAPGCK